MEDIPIFRNYLEDEDDKPYYTKNSLAYYYEDMERKEKLIKEMAKYIAGYSETLTSNFSDIEKSLTQFFSKNDKLLADRLKEWDGKLETFDDGVKGMLEEWVDDGTLNHVIDTGLIDQKVAPLTALLAEKAHESDLEIERQRISNLTANAGDTDGNAELLDIRVGFDGVTYATAGEATRALSNYMVEDGQIWEVE